MNSVRRFQCDHCHVFFCDLARVARNMWPNIPGLETRVKPGEKAPAAECPVCGGLVYPVKPEAGEYTTSSSLFSVILDLGADQDHQTFFDYADVPLNSANPTQDAVLQVRRKAAGSEKYSDDELKEMFRVLAVIEGVVTDVFEGEE
jgi:hypothetical protein